MRRWILVILCLFSVIAIAGCQSTQKQASTQAIVLHDDMGRTVTLQGPAKRIVVLSPSFIPLVTAVNGHIVGYATSTIAPIPDALKDVPSVGFFYHIDMEKVVSLKPDLVVAYAGMHERYIPILESNHIPVIVLKLKTEADVAHDLRVLGMAVGNEAKGDAVATAMEKQVKEAIQTAPASLRGKKIAIIHLTAQAVTLSTQESIAGHIANELGYVNIAKMGSGNKTPEQIPFSMETLVMDNPDIIFITSMGEDKNIAQEMKAILTSQPAWHNLKAVQAGQVYPLPRQYFLLNPGLSYAEAIPYMIKNK